MNTQQYANAAPSGTTVDASEISKFEKMAEAWWDPTGAFKPLHDLNPIRITFIRDQIIQHLFQEVDGKDADGQGAVPGARSQPLKNLRILDIGCGGGLLCEPMSRLGAKITGVDAARGNIEIARSHAKHMGLSIDYRHSTAEDLVANGEQFDVVLNMEVVEHVANVDDFVNATAQLVRPGGLMIMATLNRTMKSYAMAIVGAEYLMRWLPIGTHDWRKFMRPSELARCLRAAGMRISNLSGLTYNPLTSGWSINEHDLAVNYMIAALRDEH
jgi:2-polyprenyl-6-hydroxyphenyl methylase / 3-demethylubiquinone-9 3-methyltransferase